MKLDCELTQEFYPQYQDGDLSAGVRQRVEEHLAECRKCREVYSSGQGFKVSPAQVPPALDEKFALRLRVKKLKTISKVLLILIIVVLFSIYNSKRLNLIQDINTLEGNFARLHMSLECPGSSHMPTWLMVDEANSTLKPMERSFNWIEGLWSGDWQYVRVSGLLPHLMNLLELRRNQDAYTERDQEIADYIDAQTECLWQQMSQQREANYRKDDWGILGRPFVYLDTRALAKAVKDLNYAVAGYYLYSALPGELEPLSDQELIQRIEQVLPWQDIKVIMDHQDNLGNFKVEWANGEYEVRGHIDRFKGEIESMILGLSAIQGSEILAKEMAAQELTILLTAFYGAEYQFDLEYTGLQRRHEGVSPRLSHAFKWTPKYEGYRIKGHSVRKAGFDAHLNRLDDIYGIQVPNNPIDVTINFSPEQGMEIMGLEGEYYSETLIIYSALTDSWVLAHEYLAEHPMGTRYLNAVTGREDFLRNIFYEASRSIELQ